MYQARPSGNGDRRHGRIIGRGRDPEALIETLTERGALLLVGPLGSGKSHLVTAIARQLDEAGVDYRRVRPGSGQPRIPPAPPDTRAEVPPIILADDAQDLGPTVVEELVDAVHDGRATVLFALTVPHELGDHTPAVAPEVRRIWDLWTHGFTERIDLRPLTDDEAREFISASGADVDLLTTERLIWYANGSRRLMDEMTRELRATTHRHDLLPLLRDVSRYSRLGDAIAAHVADLGPESLEALALLGHLPRIAHADAARFIEPTTLDVLATSGMLFEDPTPWRRLSVNPVLARGAQRRLEAHTVAELLDTPISRMLDDEGRWWSDPIATVLADRMLRTPDDDTVAALSPELRHRVAISAAREANDSGLAALAAARASLDAPCSPTCALAVEIDLAQFLLSPQPTVASAPVAKAVDPGLAVALACRRRVGDPEPERTHAQPGCGASSPAHVAAWTSLFDAKMLALDDQWAAATAIATDLSSPQLPAPIRLRAALLCSLAAAQENDHDHLARCLALADALLAEDRRELLGVAEHLHAFSVRILGRALLGAVDPEDIRTSADLRRTAVRGGDPVAERMALVNARTCTFAQGGETHIYARTSDEIVWGIGAALVVKVLAVAERRGLPSDAERSDPTAHGLDSTDLELEALTRREQEIAILAHSGLSNREIAERLYLSVRTVESHIFTARQKTGSRTRRELGDIVDRLARERRAYRSP